MLSLPARSLFFAAVLCGLAVASPDDPLASADRAPLHLASESASEPLRDAQGRIHYIVDLQPEARVRDARNASPLTNFEAHHDRADLQLLGEVARDHGAQPTSVTSLVGRSFAAYLTEAQVEALRKDSRVLLITENRELETSSVWTDFNVLHETIPWGLSAVGGGSHSYGSRRVYVLDTGIAHHSELNVLERLSAQPGHSTVGCFPHATHVAGIIGARYNGYGVVGVRPGVPLISVSVGQGGQGGGCSVGSRTDMVRSGLELIRERIKQHGTVGIVNISMNGAEFRRNGTLGLAVSHLATPTKGYPGAFVAQSAGNGYQNACHVAYDDPRTNDGIMVIGAIDSNGQPVTALNGLPAFRNQPLAGDEAGSNFGPCVEAWAPGQRVRSTWSPGEAYATLSGTSMAAPHVAGVAATLAEEHQLTTPAQIEAAVRGRLVTLVGSTARIPNLQGTGATAKPTVEFAEGNSPVGHFVRFGDEVSLQYDAVGASSCDLSAFINGSPWYSVPNMPTSFIWPPGFLHQNNYRWRLQCRNGAGAVSQAEATGQIKRTVHAVAWQVATTSTGHVYQDFTGVAHHNFNSVTWVGGDPFRQRYTSSGADFCEVTSRGIANFGWTRDILWQSGPRAPILDSGTFYLPNPRTAPAPLGPYDRYSWELRCWNHEGHEVWVVMNGTQSF